MMRKTGVTLLALLALLVLLIAGCSSKDYAAERFDVDLAIQAQNTLQVTETVQFRFTGGSFTYVYRDLDRTGLDSIDQIEASMDGAALPRGNGAGQVEISDGDALRVTWHFAPVHDSTHTFTLRYRVLGAVRQEGDADVLRWIAIPQEHGYPIAESTIHLSAPAEATPLAAPRVLDGGEFTDRGDGPAVITGHDIGEDEAVIVETRYAAGSLISAAPAWQARQLERYQQSRRALPAGLAALALALLLAGTWVTRQIRRVRSPQPAADFSTDQTSLPSSTSPAIALTLARRGTPALGTLFDLAQRGVLSIEEQPKRWGTRQFVLRRAAVPSTLRPHEHGLLDALFTDKKGLIDEVPLSKSATQFAKNHKLFDKPLESEMHLAGSVDLEHDARLKGLAKQAGLMLGIGLLAIIAGGVGIGLSADRVGTVGLAFAWVLVGAGLPLFVFGLIGLIAYAAIPAFTAEGLAEGKRWQRFDKYLQQVAKGKAILPDIALFDRYLPYAAGFGLSESWAKRYQAATGFEIPAWLHTLNSDDSSAVFVAAMAAGHSSFHSSGGSSAGGGASGGGGSGAG